MSDAPVRVLLVDDDEDDAMIVREVLAECRGGPFALDWVQTAAEARERMALDAHDVWLLDYRLGGDDGLALLRDAVARDLRATVILLTGADDHALDLEAMRAGASDYLVKARLDASLLERSIRYALQAKRNERELRDREETLRELSGILADRDLALGDKVRELIALGCRRLGLPIGVLARLEGDHFVVEQSNAAHPAFVPGHRNRACETYCKDALRSREPLAIERAGATAWRDHPCYGCHGIEAYLGMAIDLDDVPFGTLALAGHAPRETPFSAMDRELLRIKTRWLGGELQRERAEQALRESEERFRQLAENVQEAFFIVAAGTGELLYVSPAFEHIWGRSREALRQPTETLLDTAHPADRERLRACLAALGGDDPAPQALELRILRPDDQVRWLRCRAVPVRGAGGAVQRIVGVAEDVTERRRAEQRQQFLVEAGMMFASSLDFERTLASIARLAVPALADWCVVDILEDDGKLRSLGIAAADPERAHTLEAHTRKYPHDMTRENHPVVDVVRSGRPLLVPWVLESYLEQIPDVDGYRTMLRGLGLRSYMIVPMAGKEGAVGALIFCRTELARPFDDADLALAEEIARRAALALENARLYGEARRAVEAREAVLGIVSHDLRSPLRSIAAGADLLREVAAANPEALEELDRVDRSIERMSRLIEDLLDVTRLEAGRLSVQLRREQPAALVAEAASATAPEAARRGLRFEVDVPADLPAVLADAGRIAQVLGNLLGNALKFTPEGGEVRLCAATHPDGVCFSVTDTGFGIAAEHLSRVFDAFWQAERGARHGAGLGLPIVRGIVEAHDGRLGVESEPGRGSTFWFTLPLAP